jgi:hypothetical protein
MQPFASLSEIVVNGTKKPGFGAADQVKRGRRFVGDAHAAPRSAVFPMAANAQR